MLASVKSLLNKFSQTQPALQIKDNSAPQGIQLGDIIDGVTAKVAQKAVFTFLAPNGAIGTTSLGLALPKGAIVTSVFTNEEVNLTSGGSATIAISAGAQVLVTAQAFSAFSGAQVQTVAAQAISAPNSELSLIIAVVALTGGKLTVWVEYLV